MSQYVLVWRKTEQNVNVAVHFLSAVFTPLVLIWSGEEKRKKKGFRPFAASHPSDEDKKQ